MITLDALCLTIRGLRAEDVQRWIAHEWVRPDPDPDADPDPGDGGYVFREIDVARVRLILSLRDEMQVNEDAMPVVLSLLDQLYDMRRRMRRVRAALDQTVTGDLRAELVRRLREVEG